MRTVGQVRFDRCDASVPPGSELISAMVAELAGMYGPVEGPGLPTATPSELGPPGGAFIVGWAGDVPVAGGGVKRLGPTLGEIKRMYVVPEWRGLGISGGLLEAIEGAAVELGYLRVRLDTGPKQLVAQELYDRRSYIRIPDYNGNPLACYWAEKVLG